MSLSLINLLPSAYLKSHSLVSTNVNLFQTSLVELPGSTTKTVAGSNSSNNNKSSNSRSCLKSKTTNLVQSVEAITIDDDDDGSNVNESKIPSPGEVSDSRSAKLPDVGTSVVSVINIFCPCFRLKLVRFGLGF